LVSGVKGITKKMFQKRALKKIFVPKRDAVTGVTGNYMVGNP
jgi:hypothetical protein